MFDAFYKSDSLSYQFTDRTDTKLLVCLHQTVFGLSKKHVKAFIFVNVNLSQDSTEIH